MLPLTSPDRRVIAIVPDLFFATRIAATARAAGVTLELTPPQHAVARVGENRPDLVVIDLHAKDAMPLVLELKAAVPGIPVVGFYSHVDTEIRREALASGADAVLPRSRFNARLADILTQGLLALGPGDAR